MSIRKATNSEDIVQVVVGASAFSVPVAFSEESWNLSRTLPLQNIVLLVILSLLFINLYSFYGIFQRNIHQRVGIFVYRTFIDYAVAFTVVFVVLLALNRMPLLSEPLVAVKRVLILSFPASMGAVVVDSFDKE